MKGTTIFSIVHHPCITHILPIIITSRPLFCFLCGVSLILLLLLFTAKHKSTTSTKIYNKNMAEERTVKAILEAMGEGANDPKLLTLLTEFLRRKYWKCKLLAWVMSHHIALLGVSFLFILTSLFLLLHHQLSSIIHHHHLPPPHSICQAKY